MDLGTPNARYNRKSWHVTPSACFYRLGEANRNLDALSATSNKYSLLASDMTPRAIRFIPLMSQDWIVRPESMATAGLLTSFVSYILTKVPALARTSRVMEGH